MELNQAEMEVILAVLQDYLPDLRLQIGSTEDYDLRQELKQREEIIKQLIQRLGGDMPSQSSQFTR